MLNIKLIIACMIIVVINTTCFGADQLESIIDHPIASQKRYELTKKYAKQHYNLDHANLIDPQMIVIHHTALATVGQTMHAFESPVISTTRDKLAAYGEVNVGVHFVVDKDGQIYSLLPTTLMGRHVIGYNYTSIGIENVALDHSRLTDAQIRSNAILVNMLVARHPSIEYLIGHIEYMDQSLPHFKLYKAKDLDYEPTIKIDPGWSFMKRLRYLLKRDYNVILKK